jgi:hypothetical protein
MKTRMNKVDVIYNGSIVYPFKIRSLRAEVNMDGSFELYDISELGRIKRIAYFNKDYSYIHTEIDENTDE